MDHSCCKFSFYMGLLTLYLSILLLESPFWGIPEILAYIVPAYFITSILIEVLLNDIPNKNVKLMLGKALILLLSFLAFTVIYWLFYKNIIIANELENTFIGKNSHFILFG